MPRTYSCKYCGFQRSRKCVVVEHEDTCKFGVLNRLELENENLKLQAQENAIVVQNLVQQVEILTKQVQGIMKRHSVAIANENV